VVVLVDFQIKAYNINYQLYILSILSRIEIHRVGKSLAKIFKIE